MKKKIILVAFMSMLLLNGVFVSAETNEDYKQKTTSNSGTAEISSWIFAIHITADGYTSRIDDTNDYVIVTHDLKNLEPFSKKLKFTLPGPAAKTYRTDEVNLFRYTGSVTVSVVLDGNEVKKEMGTLFHGIYFGFAG